MAQQFKPGDAVLVMNEAGKFIFKAYKNKTFAVLIDDFQFEREFPVNQLTAIRVSAEELMKTGKVPKEKVADKPKPKVLPKAQNSATIDLHMHELVDSHIGWTNTQIVQYQMEYLKNQLSALMQKKVRRVEIIHGVGDQVLMREVRMYLRKFKGCEINDLAFTQKGFGATEFIIRYKGNV